MTDMPIKPKKRGWFSRSPASPKKPEPKHEEVYQHEFDMPQMSYPLDRERIAELLSLEDLFVRGLLNRTKIETLLEIYRVCAEFYDSVKDPINIYFSEKIQYTVSQKNILAILSRPRTGSGCGEETLATIKRKQDGEDIRRTAEAANQANHRKDKKTTLENEQLLRSQRVRMGFEVDQKLKDETEKAQNLLLESVNTKKIIDDLVSKNLDSQKDAIRQKLETRRNASFMKSRSRLDSSISSVGNFKVNNTIGVFDTSQNPFGDTSLISIGKLENESPSIEPNEPLSAKSKRHSYFNLFGDVLNDPDLKLDLRPTDPDNGVLTVRPFDMQADDGRQLYGDKDSIQSSDSDNDDSSTRNILNGCLIKGQKRPSQLMADIMGNQGTTLHCIYEEPSPTKFIRDKSLPRSKNERESSPSQ